MVFDWKSFEVSLLAALTAALGRFAKAHRDETLGDRNTLVANRRGTSPARAEVR